MFRVTIAIVTYRSETELPRCLDSILTSDLPAKVVVIDNSPDDSTLKVARRYAGQHQNVTAISSGGNIGLAAANNLVMSYIEGDYVFILNPDTVLRTDTLSSLVKLMDANEKVGVVGPKCLYEDGTPHTSYHHGWGLRHLFLWRVLPYTWMRKLYDSLARYRETEVDYVSGACLLVRAPVFKEIGGYDPAYFLTAEDTCDLCRRVRARGYVALYSPRAVMTHFTGRSGERARYLTILEGYKGSIYHFNKYNGPLGGYFAFAIVAFGCAVKIAVSLLKIALRGREVDRQYLHVYSRILPQLLANGSKIAFSARSITTEN